MEKFMEAIGKFILKKWLLIIIVIALITRGGLAIFMKNLKMEADDSTMLSPDNPVPYFIIF